jgi:uncharacterized protein (DUF2252 family)
MDRDPKSRVPHPTFEEQEASGKAARKSVPRHSHGDWSAAADRPDPVKLLAEQDESREPDLIPVRHARMAVSPFTFYRGAARVMAADLSATPVSGLRVQLCGDAHLSNFGLFGSPERRLLFDLNDFDETLPGPWEWDVKRLAASLTIAGRNNGFDAEEIDAVTRTGVREYREAMTRFASRNVLDIWYASVDADDLTRIVKDLSPKKEKKFEAELAKARSRTSQQALTKLGEQTEDGWRIRSQPPLVVPLAELLEQYNIDPEEVRTGLVRIFRAYRRTLPDDRRHLLERYQVVDVARKVVGVGSVGTRSFIALLTGRDEDDPLFLQVKQANASVLEEYLATSAYAHHGQRVVQGQRLMQAASDIFLGWTVGVDKSIHFYWRQLRDMKFSADIDTLKPVGLTGWARLCGWTLARAHARSGSPASIAAYLGSGQQFDEALVAFAEAYADQNERDHAAFVQAIADGQLTTTTEF